MSVAFPGTTMRPLSAADATAAQGLVAEAGWNQTGDDWALMIDSGDAIGLFAKPDSAEAGELAATVTMLPYEDRFAWIGMVLVRKQWRRRGLASGLLRHCINVLLEKGITPVLDATEAGREVYVPLGFKDIFAIERLEAGGVKAPVPAPETPPGMTIGKLSENDLEPIVGWDTARFGADRGPVLRSLLRRAPHLAHLARRTDGGITGYAMGRNGRLAEQIGPIIAEDAETAEALAAAALSHSNGPAFIDAACHQSRFGEWLRGIGFVRQRGFMRMALGRAEPFERPATTFAITGPELG